MAYKFDWDPEKARANRAKHTVDFSDAQRVFDDPLAIDWIDDREDYGEVRFAILGMVGGRLLFVHAGRLHGSHHLCPKSNAQ